MANEQLDRGDLINAIWAARGKISVAAQRMGVNPSTIFDYAKRYTTVKDAIDSAREAWDEQLLDVAEVKLYDAVSSGTAWAIRYALATKGKVRGYVERSELTGKDGGDLVVKVVRSNDAED